MIGGILRVLPVRRRTARSMPSTFSGRWSSEHGRVWYRWRTTFSKEKLCVLCSSFPSAQRKSSWFFNTSKHVCRANGVLPRMALLIFLRISLRQVEERKQRSNLIKYTTNRGLVSRRLQAAKVRALFSLLYVCAFVSCCLLLAHR